MKANKQLFGVLIMALCLFVILTGCGKSGSGTIVEREATIEGGGGPATVSSMNRKLYDWEQELNQEWEHVERLESKREAHPDSKGLCIFKARYSVKGKKQ